MCGINGIYSFKSTLQSTSSLVEKMNNSIAHRGPDAEGIFEDKNVVLGHRRLSIIDISESSNQPMKGLNDRYTLVFNGEIYNYRDLKSNIDFPYKTNSDSEIIIAAFHKWGKDCVNKFNGMFAFAIWDKHEESLFIARDRVGIKPIYYHHSSDQFIFSSQIKGILATGEVSTNLNISQLSSFLKFQTIYAPNTILEDINLLEAGTTLTVNNKGVKKERYWSADEKAVIKKHKDHKDIITNINELLTNSVEKRMVSDVPFGAFLSGGIDSSLMVALMSKSSNHPINTFNINFAEKEFSESIYAEKIADKYNTNHTEIKLTPDDLLGDIENALSFMDYPTADGINTFVVSKHTRKHGIKMAISGLGGDELFAGYPQFKQMVLLDKIRHLDKVPYQLRSFLSEKIYNNTTKAEIKKISGWLNVKKWDFNGLYPSFRQQLSDNNISNILKEPVFENINYFNKSSTINNMTVNEINTYLQHILLRDSDQMSMASSLEVRVPFMDHELIEYVLTVSDKYKYPSIQKKLLVESFPDILTPEIINRKKMGFIFPWDRWLRNELRDFAEKNLKELGNHKEFNIDNILIMWNKFLDGDKSIYWTQIWGLVVLANWLKRINNR